ncbi:hypothetical protein ACQUFY_17410 [Robbsia andropogonis]|uniref:hypothetical protein n=1 Tax=Robbsia andropogonis TaxID=28092 RepID=UPI003D2562CA
MDSGSTDVLIRPSFRELDEWASVMHSPTTSKKPNIYITSPEASRVRTVPLADPSEEATTYGAASCLSELPADRLIVVTGGLPWDSLVQLSICSRRLYRLSLGCAIYRIQRVTDVVGMIDVMCGIKRMAEARHPILLRELSTRMIGIKGSGSEMVLQMWRESIRRSQHWIVRQPDELQGEAIVNLMIAAYGAILPRDRVKPHALVQAVLMDMSKLMLIRWPPILEVLVAAGGHRQLVTRYVDHFAKYFQGTLSSVSDTFAFELGSTLLLRLHTRNVSKAMSLHFGVSDAQHARIADNIAYAIAKHVVESPRTLYMSGSLDERCRRWDRRVGSDVKRLAERHLVSMLGSRMRSDGSWRVLLEKSDATSDRVMMAARRHILTLESDTLQALPNETQHNLFLALHQSFGEVEGADAWKKSYKMVEGMPWEAQPALMHRLACRLAPVEHRAWFDDEDRFSLLDSASAWAIEIVPRCARNGRSGLGGRAFAALLSLWAALGEVDRKGKEDVFHEAFSSLPVALPPPDWGPTLDSVGLFNHRHGSDLFGLVDQVALNALLKRFLCDKHSRVMSPSPYFAKWICKEVPAYWGALPDGDRPVERWHAFCSRFDLPREMRTQLRRDVLQHYARNLAQAPTSFDEVLSRAGFHDSQGRHEFEEACWDVQSALPDDTTLARRLHVFGLTDRLRERITARFGGEVLRRRRR